MLQRFPIKTISAILIASFCFLHFGVPRLITQIRFPLQSKEVSPPSNYEFTPFTYQTFDQLTIAGSLFSSPHIPPRGSIILLHGIRSRKEHLYPMANKIAVSGYNVFVIDLRAHGDSEGTYCTFGAKEKQDIKALVDCIHANFGLHEPIGILGQSLGGAIALQALAEDKRISYGVIESTFSDFKTVASDYITRITGIENEFFKNYLINRSANIADFDIDLVIPSKSCTKIDQNVLLVHGKNDKRIALKHYLENSRSFQFNNCKTKLIDNANHLNVWQVGGATYFNEVMSFLDEYTQLK